MSAIKRPTVTIHRDARTGRIVPPSEVIRRPATTVTEHYPVRPTGKPPAHVPVRPPFKTPFTR